MGGKDGQVLIKEEDGSKKKYRWLLDRAGEHNKLGHDKVASVSPFELPMVNSNAASLLSAALALASKSSRLDIVICKKNKKNTLD